MEEHRGSSRSADSHQRRREVVSGKRPSSTNNVYVTSYGSHSPDFYLSSSADTRPPRLRERAAAKPWGFNDPEMKRQRRIAKYKYIGVEGRVKASIRNGFRWIKNKCSAIVDGF